MRDLRSAGVNIPILDKVKCDVHNKSVTIDHIQTPYVIGNGYARAKYTPAEIETIRKALGNKDGFIQIETGTNLEIDHRIPLVRARTLKEGGIEEKVDTSNQEDITDRYQLLSRQNNLYKSRVCEKCVESNIKPTKFLFLDIPKKSGGGEVYVEGENDCTSCPLAYPERFTGKLKYED